MDIAKLVERSAHLKRELIDFSCGRRFDREYREVILDHFPSGIVTDEETLILVTDYFVLQHQLRSGGTVLERFVASRPDLSEADRDMVLSWRDVVEGVFEVRRRHGDVLMVENLIDELTYRVRSNMAPVRSAR